MPLGKVQKALKKYYFEGLVTLDELWNECPQNKNSVVYVTLEMKFWTAHMTLEKKGTALSFFLGSPNP